MSQRSAGSCTRCTRANAFPVGHIKLEFGFVKLVEKEDNHGAGYKSDKFFPDDVETTKKSSHFSSKEKDSKTELARFFSEDEDVNFFL